MLFCNIDLLDEKYETKRNQYVGVKDGRIAYIGASAPEEDFGERYDGRHRLLMPAFYNVHSHAPMTLLRGYAENLPLQRWLGEKVFPFEDQIDDEAAYYGTLLAISEMLASGTASFSDMYFFFGGMVPAILESGIKCNLSRGLTVFDDSDYTDLPAYRDNVRLRGEWNGANNGRLIGDLCIHGEYTSNPKIVEAVAQHARETGARIQIHLSETQTEHEECKGRHGLTPAAYMEKHGIFDSPTTAAHCVHLTQEDMKLLAKRRVSAVHCPVSNLKLASGCADVMGMVKAGMNVCLGTDSVASNNNLDLFEEIKACTLMAKAKTGDPTAIPAEAALMMATVCGAKAQGREKECGQIKLGMDADLILLDFTQPHLIPCHNVLSNLVYAASGHDVVLTMVRGQILYNAGKFPTLDLAGALKELHDYAIPKVFSDDSEEAPK